MTGDGRFRPIALQHSFTVERSSSKGSERQKPTRIGHSTGTGKRGLRNR
jgi:hypothetical protein